MLPNIIDTSQSAFIRGRELLDSILVANEVVEDIKREKTKWVIIKVDYEKTYDSMRWDFLYYMMDRLGFSRKWIGWSKECMESSTISVLVNGTPTQEFKPTRGLRQGDPTAAFLFIIVAEGLAGLVRQAVKNKLLEGVKVGINEVEINILQFAEDTLFVCNAKYQNVVTTKSILKCFVLASGLKVNFHKSKIGVIGIEKSELDRFSETLNYNQTKIPFKYLRLPIGGNPRKKEF